jgi:hypothetical protein
VGVSRRTVLVLGAGAVVATLAVELDAVDRADNRSAPEPAPPGATVAHAIPADAVWVGPSGNDTAPGTRSSPRATLQPGRVNVLTDGTYYGFSQTLPNGTATTVIVPEGQTAVLDGQGTIETALVCGGRTNLYGDLRVTSYAPTSSNVGSNAPIYFGGTAGGSEIDGPTISNSKMAALGFQVPLVITKLTVVGCGYSGILGTTADGTTFGRVDVFRVNRDNHSQDGQLGAIKITRSADVTFSKDVRVVETNGAHGIWTDVSCRRPVVAGAKVLTGAGKPADVGLLLEETEGGSVVGAEVEGAYAAELVATGHVRVWSNTFTGTSVALTVVQDRNGNSGTNPANLDPTLAPWQAVGNEICDNQLTTTGGYRVAFATQTRNDGRGTLTTEEMLAALKGNRFGGMVQLEGVRGGRRTLDAAGLAARLGSTYDAATQTLPDDLQALLST